MSEAAVCLSCSLDDCHPDSPRCALKHVIGQEQNSDDDFTSELRHRIQANPLRERADDDFLDLSTVSRVEVAKAVHVVPEHISQIFLGKANCSLPLAYDIAQYLGTTIDNLYRTISGANGTNPRRMSHNRFRPKATWKSWEPLPPKYSVDGKGYPNLREALLACGVERQRPTHYNALPDDLKARIVRNRPHRGR